MKFNLRLDESLFDDEIDSYLTQETPSQLTEFDDDFSEYEPIHDVDNVLPGPSEGPDTGIASEIIALINDEWEAIQGYNNAIASLRTVVPQNPFYEDAIKVLEEISSEENVHVGQLQEVLKHISPNAAEIHKGTKEARNQLGLVGGILPVQTWDEVNTTEAESKQVNHIEETCTLNDVDDDM